MSTRLKWWRWLGRKREGVGEMVYIPRSLVQNENVHVFLISNFSVFFYVYVIWYLQRSLDRRSSFSCPLYPTAMHMNPRPCTRAHGHNKFFTLAPETRNGESGDSPLSRRWGSGPRTWHTPSAWAVCLRLAGAPAPWTPPPPAQ
jgi:hypothetical protein